MELFLSNRSNMTLLPLLKLGESGSFECHGGDKKTYQEWLDEAGMYFDGICVDGWRYVKILIQIHMPTNV